MEANATSLRPRWWILVAGVLVLVAATTLTAIWAAPFFTRARIESWVHAAGLWGPLVLLGLQALQIVAAPIPGVFVPIMAGVLYGPIEGPLLTMGGTLVGSAVAYWIGRSAGHAVAERYVGAAAMARAHQLLEGKRWIALAVLFLIPFSPADAMCFVSGTVGMRWSLFTAAVLVGRLPKDILISAGAALGWAQLMMP